MKMKKSNINEIMKIMSKMKGKWKIIENRNEIMKKWNSNNEKHHQRKIIMLKENNRRK